MSIQGPGAWCSLGDGVAAEIHHRQPRARHQQPRRGLQGDPEPRGKLGSCDFHNITSLTKNWFCYDAHFKHQQAKRWILKRFVGVSQEEQVLNL